MYKNAFSQTTGQSYVFYITNANSTLQKKMRKEKKSVMYSFGLFFPPFRLVENSCNDDNSFLLKIFEQG